MLMMMMDERSKGTCFPSAEAAYIRLCFTYNHQAMSIYHPVSSSSAFVFSCDSVRQERHNDAT